MFRCLECNARTAVPTVEAVNGLSFDWVAIDGVRRKAQTLGTYGCDECAEDEEATFWCESCGIGLCAFHRENHAKSRKTANHRVRQIDEDGGEAAVIGSLPDEAAAAAADDDDASDWGGYSSSDDGAAPPPPEEKREGAGAMHCEERLFFSSARAAADSGGGSGTQSAWHLANTVPAADAQTQRPECARAETG